MPWKLLLLVAVLVALAGLAYRGLQSPDPQPAEKPRPAVSPGPVPTPPSEESPVAAKPKDESPGQVIRGRVVDPEGRPVAGAKVSWFRGPRVRTDGDGRFEIPGRPKVRTHLKVDHRSFLIPRLHLLSSSSGHVIALEAGLSISGRVTGKDGRGVAGIWVTAGRPRARTDADGRYRITGLEAGECAITCRFPRSRFTDEEGEILTGTKGKTIRAPAGSQGVDFLATGRPLEVRVVDEDGRPLPGVRVTAQAGGGSNRARRGATGANGCAFTLLPWVGRIDLAASAPGYEPARAVLEPEPSEPRLRCELTLRRPGRPAALEVRAHDDRGAPLTYLHVSLLDPLQAPLAGYRDLRVGLDRLGRGRIEGLPPGRFAAQFSDARFGRSEHGYALPVKKSLVLVRGESAGVELTLVLGGRIRAVVRGPDGKVSWPGQMWLRSLATGNFEKWTRFGHRAGEEFKTAGSVRVPVFVLRPIPVGEYEVIARWNGRRGTQIGAPVTVRRGVTVEVELSADR